MKKSDFSRLLRRSNVEDLLDDGIENGSDLRKPAIIPGVADESAGVDRESAEPPVSTLIAHAPQDPAVAPTSGSRWEGISKFGLALGACLVVCGVFVVMFPHEIWILHVYATGRSRSFLEHVTASGAKAYGVLSILFGIALSVYSVYRPRK